MWVWISCLRMCWVLSGMTFSTHFPVALRVDRSSSIIPNAMVFVASRGMPWDPPAVRKECLIYGYNLSWSTQLVRHCHRQCDPKQLADAVHKCSPCLVGDLTLLLSSDVRRGRRKPIQHFDIALRCQVAGQVVRERAFLPPCHLFVAQLFLLLHIWWGSST